MEFIKANGIDQKIKELKKLDVEKNQTLIKERLNEIKKLINNSTLPKELIIEFKNKVSQKYPELASGKIKLRLRSSSNVEDLKWFSGAGLHDSTNAKLDSNKDLEKAIKYVWASLWNEVAYQTRRKANIDQDTVAMAVLIHPQFKDEIANGVFFTGSSKNPDTLTINVNFGSLAVTNPEKQALPETIQMKRNKPNANPKYIRLSNVKAGEYVLNSEQIEEIRIVADRIHNLFGGQTPMDVEFKIMRSADGKGTQLMIKQARPYLY